MPGSRDPGALSPGAITMDRKKILKYSQFCNSVSLTNTCIIFPKRLNYTAAIDLRLKKLVYKPKDSNHHTCLAKKLSFQEKITIPTKNITSYT